MFENNYQYVVVEIDPEQAGLQRDIFFDLLSAENVFCSRPFYPGVHRMLPHSRIPTTTGSFVGTDRLCHRILQLPTSYTMTDEDVERICSLFRNIQQLAGPIRLKMEQTL